jgi:monoterpene epsilon-lactone hydrolase
MSRQQLAAILEMTSQNHPPENPTPDMMRAWVEAATSHTPIARNVTIERMRCGPCDGDLILPAEGDASRLIIFYHGGGFFFCSSRTHRVVASNLARAAGCAVLVPDYRLAPEHPAPAAHDDAFGVYQWVLSQGYPAAKVALSGDSAGGNLSLDTALRARRAGIDLPCALALMSPWLDFAEEGDSYRDTPDDPIFSTELLNLFKHHYIGDGDRKSPGVTPFYADFSGLPPSLVHVGSWEKLRDDAVTVSARLRAAGVSAELKIFDGMCHTWQMFAPMLDEGMASIEECAAFIKAHQAK